MRTLVTVARLRDIKLHAFRDRTGDIHVTGFTIHGALVIPTRPFWIELAQLRAGVIADFADFGSEYDTYKKCVAAFGDHELYFSIAVDDDNTALLDGVARSYESTDAPQAMIRSLLAARRGAFGDRDSCRFMMQDGVEEFRNQFFDDDSDHDQQDDCYVEGESDCEADDRPFDDVPVFGEPDANDWPLLSTPLEPARDLWGWESFHRLPEDEELLMMRSPEGTVRPSVN